MGSCHLSTRQAPRQVAVLAVQVPTETEEVLTFDTQEGGVEAAAAAELNPRFRLSATAPIFDSPLMDYVGLLGEKPAVKEILNGTFIFPPGTDRWTIAIMHEACNIFQKMSPEDIVDLVSKDDFQEYWTTAREMTSSSHIDLHFGIYMANSERSDKLSLLHACKLSLAAKLGITLDRWHKALTVLLEKTFGCMLITKLSRAICLLEANYNWLMKLVYTKRMMDNAREKGVIPPEQIAKKGSRAHKMVVSSRLFTMIQLESSTIRQLPL